MPDITTLLPHALLTLLYAAMLLYITPRLSLFRDSGLSPVIIRGVLGVKMVAALIYGTVYLFYYDGGDTWSYWLCGRMIHDTIYINPLYFLEIEFGPNARIPPDYLCDIIEPIMYWSDWRTFTVLRVNALLHFLSFGYYGVHAVFFAFFSMTGLICIYRLMAFQDNYAVGADNNTQSLLPDRELEIKDDRNVFKNINLLWGRMNFRQQGAFCAVFGLPSVIFWASGVHKEALGILSIGFSTFFILNILNKKQIVRSVFYLSLCCGFLLMLRPYIVLLLIPASIAWGIARRNPLRTAYIFGAVYLCGFLATIAVAQIHPSLNIFTKLSEIQYYFIAYIEGGTDIPVTRLLPHWGSLLMALPRALYNVVLLPAFYLGWSNLMVRLPAAIETLFFMLVIAVSLYKNYGKKVALSDRPFWYFCLFFSVSYFMLIGLITDNLGAIVRYRTTALPFWLWFWVLPWVDGKLRNGNKIKLEFARDEFSA